MGNRNSNGTPLNITAFDFCLDDVKGKFLSSLRRQGFSTPKHTAPTLGAELRIYVLVINILNQV